MANHVQQVDSHAIDASAVPGIHRSIQNRTCAILFNRSPRLIEMLSLGDFPPNFKRCALGGVAAALAQYRFVQTDEK